MTPSRRLNRLLGRLSRDRWVKPDDARRIAVRFAKRRSGAWAKVLNTVPLEVFHVGMIRGLPVAWSWDRGAYEKVLAVVRRKRMTDEQKMIEFLKIAEEWKIT